MDRIARQNKKENKMNKRMIQKLVHSLVALVVLAGLMFVTGCDPQKIGGGGHLQSYSRLTGQYK